jgi:hypothetical protein
MTNVQSPTAAEATSLQHDLSLIELDDEQLDMVVGGRGPVAGWGCTEIADGPVGGW